MISTKYGAFQQLIEDACGQVGGSRRTDPPLRFPTASQAATMTTSHNSTYFYSDCMAWDQTLTGRRSVAPWAVFRTCAPRKFRIISWLIGRESSSTGLAEVRAKCTPPRTPMRRGFAAPVAAAKPAMAHRYLAVFAFAPHRFDRCRIATGLAQHQLCGNPRATSPPAKLDAMVQFPIGPTQHLAVLAYFTALSSHPWPMAERLGRDQHPLRVQVQRPSRMY